MKGDFSRDTFDPTKHYSGVSMQQGRVQLDADWNEQQRIQQYRAETTAQDVIGPSGAPVHRAGFQITLGQDGKALRIGKGRFYVDGILCENESDIDYQQQPDLPDAPEVIATLTAAGTTVGLIYLDVWQRHLTALDDPSIREVALGGPDTTTRTKIVWQVKFLAVKPPDPNLVSCGVAFTEWDQLVAPATGALSARTRPVAGTDNPCLLPPEAGYRRLENQLYRVEIHQGGQAGTATFKWSRDNGAVVTAVEKFDGQDITVHDVGPDDTLGFANGQGVEVVDDSSELNGRPGQLLQIDQVNPAMRVITLKSAPTPIDLSRHPKLRRWDSIGELTVQIPADNEGFIPLEDGVEIKFTAGSYSTGDYWLIPARTVTGDIVWPFASPQPPLGITHHYCRLALVQSTTDNSLILHDCREFFLPLTETPLAMHVIGISWGNDDEVLLKEFIDNGLQVILDGVPTQNADPATLIVVVEAPGLGAGATADTTALPFSSFILPGVLNFSANTIQWKPAPDALLLLVNLAAARQQELLRVRVTLKGHVIWSDQNKQRLYLDGQTSGKPGLRATGEGQSRIDLVFPTGVDARASDFESWFYMRHDALVPSLVAITIEPNTVIAGSGATVTLSLSSAALAGGAAINLISSNTDVAPVLQTVTVPAGQLQTSVTVATSAAAGNGVNVVITATLGQVTMKATLTVQVVTVTIAPQNVRLLSNVREDHSQQFIATVSGTANTKVNWSIQEVGQGSITSTGLYTAPRQQQNRDLIVHVVATSAVAPNKSATATITLHG